MDETWTVEVRIARPDGSEAVWVVDNVDSEDEAREAVSFLDNEWANAYGFPFAQLEDSKP